MDGRIVRGAILALILAVIMNLITFTAASRAGASFLTNPANPQSMTLVEIMLVTIGLVILGAVVMIMLDRFLPERAKTIFLWTAVLVSLISLIIPYNFAIGMGTFAAIGIMYITTPLAIILGLVIFTD